jgi:hypothetical protein
MKVRRNSMRFELPVKVGAALLGAAMLLASTLSAQQKRPLAATRAETRAEAYDQARETLVQGTVLSYTENSAVPPIGAHVTVQTAGGAVDVHLGPASLLQANHFSLAAGDSVRFVGVSIATDKGNIFLARTAQKGNQLIAIRSLRGFLLAGAAARTTAQAQRAQTTQAVPR